MGNACYYSVEKLMSSSLLSKNLKVRIYKTVILPVVLYGCETWTLTLREEQRLRVFENKVLRKIFGAKRDAVTGEWRKLHNAELHALYSSRDIIRNIKSRRLRWAGHVARMGESRNAYRVLVGRPEGKRPLGMPRRRWEDNIKMDLREVGYDGRDWINLAQHRDRWRAYVRAAMNLRNIHLVKKWLPSLEKKLEHYSQGSHPDYRVFMSAEPAATAAAHIIPQGILESSIKITNEPPTGMQANLHKALDNFNQETLEMCSKEAEFKAILFSLCYFHAVVAERRKFGPQGWNKIYPFNVGDLNISVSVLYNYLEANSKVPWEDLRYLFGEIMYGGHITDDWDRRLCISYLEELMQPELVDGELQLAPGFPAPPNTDYVGYHTYIDEMMPPESPYLYGLHPNAEIGFLTTTSENLFRTVFEMQPRDAGASGGATITPEEKEVGCVSSDGSTRRADIVIIDRQKDKGVILDPTIRFEMHEQQPQEVCLEKQVIYERCCQHLGAQYHITHWTVLDSCSVPVARSHVKL
ncbi:hypothetical protein ANN_25437 [Periplaneta americana]|uniref:Uncharacterized protein n=1 Tax=Periplaneta americana TaxID=6978 RepID=A0ABQ8S1C8_PERAM|nr:hypothetical protein ANN_25437 [Periplaneta americana]